MHPHGRRCSSFKYRPDILSRRALPTGRLAGLGARPYFHHGLLAFAVFVMLGSQSGQAQSAAPGPDIRGGWNAELYALKTGERHPVKGSIIFTATDWSVTFFVMPDGQPPQRAAAEGGTYTLDGTKLVLRHLYNFSTGTAVPGLPASPMRMTVQDRLTATVEHVTVAVDVERLTLSFPSGNSMSFRRSSRF